MEHPRGARRTRRTGGAKVGGFSCREGPTSAVSWPPGLPVRWLCMAVGVLGHMYTYPVAGPLGPRRRTRAGAGDRRLLTMGCEHWLAGDADCRQAGRGCHVRSVRVCLAPQNSRRLCTTTTQRGQHQACQQGQPESPRGRLSLCVCACTKRHINYHSSGSTRTFDRWQTLPCLVDTHIHPPTKASAHIPHALIAVVVVVVVVNLSTSVPI